jgi:FAD/FMN-containing dehydrogenase
MALASCGPRGGQPTVLNDVHSRLNRTEVAEYHEPRTREEIVALVRKAAREGRAISISGGRHAMGGQQFGEGTVHVNLSRYDRVVGLDEERGWVTVESGIRWPALIDWLVTRQAGRERSWGIRQKQTGADALSIGGALSANVHGRGLSFTPIVGDVEAFELVDPRGELRYCSREENPELFELAIGGYGLFGIITEVTLRLTPRVKVERKVEVVRLADVPGLVEQRIRDGFVYGDYQFKTTRQTELSNERWNELYLLAHLDKSRAFQVYADYYRSTDGQIYWSDSHQLSSYVEGLDESVDRALEARAPGSLMIGEFYVPRSRLPEFLLRSGEVIRETKANLVYGTVRYIAEDGETFLAWAKQAYACTVMNLRVTHDPAGLEEAQAQFRALIDVALSLDGSFFLTYHRWARKDQVLSAYPQFPEFLRRKRHFDPDERFQSEWYRHYERMFASELGGP